MLRRLVRIQLGLVAAFLLALWDVISAESSGKASAAIWKDTTTSTSGKKLSAIAAWLMTVGAGLTIKWNVAEEKMNSLVVEGAITEEGSTMFLVGTAGAGATLLEVKAGESMKVASMQLKSTNANREKIILNGPCETGGTVKIVSGKYKVEGSAALKFGAPTTMEGSADLEMGSSTLEVTTFLMSSANFFQSAGKIISVGGSFLTGIALAGEHLGLASSTIDITGGVGGGESGTAGLTTAATTLGTVILRKCVRVKEALKCGPLELLNKGVGAEAGARLDTAATHTFTALTCDGTGASKARLESSAKGTKTQLELAAGGVQVTGVLEAEDIWATEAAPLYLGPEGKVGANCKFVLAANKPSEEIKTEALRQAIGLGQALAGRKIAQAAPTQTIKLTNTLADQKVAQAALAQTSGTAQTTAGRKISLAAIAQRIGLAGALQATTKRSVAIAQAIGLSQALAAGKRTTAALSQAIGVKQAQAGRKVATAPLTAAIGLGGAVAGTTRRFVALLGRMGLRNILEAREPEPERHTVFLHTGAGDELVYPSGAAEATLYSAGSNDSLLTPSEGGST